MLLTKLLSLVTLCLTLFCTGKPKLHKILDYCICSHILNRDIPEGICSPTRGKNLSKSYKMGSVFPFCLSPVPYCIWVAEGQYSAAEVVSCVRFFYRQGFYVSPALAYAHFPSYLLPRQEGIFGNTEGLNKVTYILKRLLKHDHFVTRTVAVATAIFI